MLANVDRVDRVDLPTRLTFRVPLSGLRRVARARSMRSVVHQLAREPERVILRRQYLGSIPSPRAKVRDRLCGDAAALWGIMGGRFHENDVEVVVFLLVAYLAVDALFPSLLRFQNPGSQPDDASLRRSLRPRSSCRGS